MFPIGRAPSRTWCFWCRFEYGDGLNLWRTQLANGDHHMPLSLHFVLCETDYCIPGDAKTH